MTRRDPDTKVVCPRWCDPTLCEIEPGLTGPWGSHRKNLHTLTTDEDHDLVIIEREQFESDEGDLSEPRIRIRPDSDYVDNRVSLNAWDVRQLAIRLMEAAHGLGVADGGLGAFVTAMTVQR